MLMHLPAVVVLLTVLLLAFTMGMVGRARGRYAIKAPATTGNADFERVFRVQMNTLESTVMFLPTLWFSTQYAGAAASGVLGVIWIALRVWYALAYAKDASKRGIAYIASLVVIVLLLIAGSWGLLRQLLG